MSDFLQGLAKGDRSESAPRLVLGLREPSRSHMDYTVDTKNGEIVRSGPATARDIAQATLRGKFR